MNSAIISIGNEILLGKTLNTNLQYLATQMAGLGLAVDYAVTIKDELSVIRATLDYCWSRYDIVISTGGLGPTADDITKDAIVSFFGGDLVFREEIWQEVTDRFKARGLDVPRINRNQALVPTGFVALNNAQGTAPGLFYSDGSRSFFALPGVPLEMEHLFERHLRGLLKERYGAQSVIQRNIHTHGISESALAELLADFEIPAGVNLAWLPQTGRVDLRLYGQDEALIGQTLESMAARVQKHVWGYDGDSPVTKLGELLQARGWLISCAESCTGGLVQKMLTDQAGSSAYFSGGLVSYSNAQKVALLGVSTDTLERYGAVSAETAGEMVYGLTMLCKTEVAVSITGIAGPEGGSDAKPVGLVYFGFAIPGKTWVCKQIFSGTRASIRQKAADYALISLIKELTELVP